MKRIRQGATCCLILFLFAGTMTAQEEGRTFEQRLIAFTNQLRMALTLSTVAAHSPTLRDVQLHAQQLVNLLEGSGGRHYSPPAGSEEAVEGLMHAMSAWEDRFAQADIAPSLRTTLSASARNVATYLAFALDATLSGLQQRRLDLAIRHMLQAYAFLLAAYEKPCDTSYVPALWTILRAFGLGMEAETAGTG